jgi:hypothetical protein
MDVSDQLHVSAALHLGERAPFRGTHRIGGWMGPRTDLDAVEEEKNILPLLEIERRP